jgi:hypothetical protein
MSGVFSPTRAPRVDRKDYAKAANPRRLFRADAPA